MMPDRVPAKGSARDRPHVTDLPRAMIDGVLRDTPTISVFDDGLLRGDGAFEVLRLYHGVPFAKEQHLSRLAHTACGLRMSCDPAAFAHDIDTLLTQHPVDDSLLRIVLTRGGRRIVMLEAVPETPPTASLFSVPFRVNPLTAGLKTLSYASNAIAARVATEQGADLALLITPEGEVLEGPNFAVFFGFAGAGTLLTPPLSAGILDSITRRYLIDALAIEERHVHAAQLCDVVEAFIASTVREVMPVSSIDGHDLPLRPGPRTEAARAFYATAVIP